MTMIFFQLFVPVSLNPKGLLSEWHISPRATILWDKSSHTCSKEAVN